MIRLRHRVLALLLVLASAPASAQDPTDAALAKLPEGRLEPTIEITLGAASGSYAGPTDLPSQLEDDPARSDGVVVRVGRVLPDRRAVVFYAGAAYTTFEPSSTYAGIGADVSSLFAFGGAKVRGDLPIGKVAPFAEFGVGLAAGRFRTQPMAGVGGTEKGVFPQIAVGVGVAFGRGPDRAVRIAAEALAGSSDQVVGMFTVTMPLTR